MEYSVGQVGRVIVARLEDDEAIYPSIETICVKESIQSAAVWIIGGIKRGGVIVGPKDPDQRPPEPMLEKFNDARELLGVATVFPNESGQPTLHLHAAIGREKNPLVGCPREGADCWLINEIVIMELSGIQAKRILDKESGFELLNIFGMDHGIVIS